MSWFSKERDETEHRYVETRLSAYIDGALSSEERVAVDRHLATCRTCRWNLETLRQTVQWTRELPTLPVPRVFTLPVPAQPRRAARRQWRFVPLLQGATALVALLLVFTVAGDLLMSQFSPLSQSQPEVLLQQAPMEVVSTVVVEEVVEVPAAEPQMERSEDIVTVVVQAEAEPIGDAGSETVEHTAAPLMALQSELEPSATGSEEMEAGNSRDEEMEAAVAQEEKRAPLAMSDQARLSPSPEATAKGEVEKPAVGLAPSPVPTLSPTPAVARQSPMAPARSTEPPLEARALKVELVRGRVATSLDIAQAVLAVLLVLLGAVTLVATLQRRREH